MQPIDFTKSEAFASVFAKMGIHGEKPPQIHIEPYEFSDRIWNNNLQEGLRVTPAECMEGDLKETRRGFLYKGAKAIVYWSERLSAIKSNDGMQNAARYYHITLCSTMENLFEKMPNARIMTIIGQARHDYPVHMYNRKGEMESERNAYLTICPECLEKLNWQGFKCASPEERMRKRWRFYLADYLKR